MTVRHGPCPVGATRPDSDHLEPATLQRTPMRCQARPLRRRRGSAALLHDAQNYPPRIRAGLWSRGVTPLRSSLFRYLLTVLLAFAATRVVATLGAALAVPPGGSLLQSLAATWDPRWYLDIAKYGYDDADDLSDQLRVDCSDTTRAGCLRTPDRYSNLAFFPISQLSSGP